jgi:hypothetical protein
VGGNGVKSGSAGVEEVHNATEKFCLYLYCDMWPKSCNLPICWAGLHGARYHGNTKCPVPLGFDGTFEDISMVMTSKQTLTMDMKNRTLQGGDSYPSRLAGIKGEAVSSEVKSDGEPEYDRTWKKKEK